MAHDLLTAFALVLILEGVLPGIAPSAYLRMLAQAKALGVRRLRIIGVCCMLAGALMLQYLK